VLAQYSDIHEGAWFDVNAGSTQDKIARYEIQLGRKFNDKLSLQLQIQKFRKNTVKVFPD